MAQSKRQGAVTRKQNVPIWIEERTGVDRADDILLGGVPVGRGLLKKGGFFELTPSGKPGRLVEGTPAAYWPDGSTKWLSLCGLVDLAGGKRNEFELDLQPRVAPAGLKVHRDRTLNSGEPAVRITGGLLQVDVTAEQGGVLAVRHQGKACLINPGLSARMELTDGTGGNRRRLDWTVTDKEPQVVVQTANRVVIRLAGEFVKPGGQSAGELVLFIETFRESAELRIEPVFIYLGNPDEDLVASLTLTAHTLMHGTDAEYGFGNEKGRGFWDVVQRVKNDERGGDGPIWLQARQTQLGSSFFVTEKRTGDDVAWVKCVEGGRAMGWCHFKDTEGLSWKTVKNASKDGTDVPAPVCRNVTAAMRCFWQEYPRSFTVDAARGTLTFGLVPPEAKPLDLRRYSNTSFGGAMYETGYGPLPSTHGATGIAKASELMLRFDTTGASDAPERGLFFVQPARPMTPPRYFAETQVIGRVAPVRPGVLPKTEAFLAETADFMVKEREVRGWYGLMDYGDIHCGYLSDLDRWAFDDGGYAWINTEGIPDYGLWLQALRSARADWLEAGIDMTRHNRDVDMYHRGPLQGLGSRHNVSHWGCRDKEWRVSMPLVKRLHYYLTGDPWTAEVIRRTVAVYQKYERTAKVAPGQTAAFAGILVRWEMDHDERDGVALARFADALAASVREDGSFTHDLHVNLATGEGHPVGDKPLTDLFWLNIFGAMHAMVEYAELAGHDRLSKALTRHVRYNSGAETMAFLAHAYRDTGDEALKQAIAKRMDEFWYTFTEIGGEGILAEPSHKCLANLKRRNKIGCALGGMMHQLPFGMAVL
jgi:hypothetical protein